jgi:co-chaperonin GroES (HSP10)
MRLKAVGHRVLVKVIDTSVEEVKSDSGIILEIKNKDQQQLEKVNSELAEIIDIGPQAWDAFGDGSNWAELGDIVRMRKYSGVNIEDPDEEGVLYRLINDEDIYCIVEEA